MGLLSRAAKIMAKPSGLSDHEWALLARNLDRGNLLLGRIMRDPKAGAFEWGGWASPRRLDAPRTDYDAFGVGIDRGTDPFATIQYHTHPHVIEDGLGHQYPAVLSTGDLISQGERGITSLEPQGGFGYAVHAPRAPNLSEDAWIAIQDAAETGAEKKTPGLRFELPGAGAYLQTSDDGLSETLIAAQPAIGRAMRRTGMLEQYGYRPGTEAQARTLERYRPAIDGASRAAEEELRKHLRKTGFLPAFLGGGLLSAAQRRRERAAA